MKGLDKLLEVIADGLGGITRPWMLKRIADAKAYSIRTLEAARTEAEVSNIREIAAAKSAAKMLRHRTLLALDDEVSDVATPDPVLEVSEPKLLSERSFESRIEERLRAREETRQSNLEKISVGAAAALEEDEVSDVPVDPDWIARFFASAEDVSNAQMQGMWSALLAGEIRTPNSVPVRAVEILRNMTTREAQMFEMAKRYVMSREAQSELILPSVPSVRVLMNELTDSGLVSPEGFSYASEGADDVDVFDYLGAKLAFASVDKETRYSSFYRLTSAGSAITNVTLKNASLPSRTMLRELFADRYKIDWKIAPSGEDWMSIPEYLERRKTLSEAQQNR
jgi:hypothetical protein